MACARQQHQRHHYTVVRRACMPAGGTTTPSCTACMLVLRQVPSHTLTGAGAVLLQCPATASISMHARCVRARSAARSLVSPSSRAARGTAQPRPALHRPHTQAGMQHRHACPARPARAQLAARACCWENQPTHTRDTAASHTTTTMSESGSGYRRSTCLRLPIKSRIQDWA